jgi:hypothetical protein
MFSGSRERRIVPKVVGPLRKENSAEQAASLGVRECRCLFSKGFFVFRSRGGVGEAEKEAGNIAQAQRIAWLASKLCFGSQFSFFLISSFESDSCV